MTLYNLYQHIISKLSESVESDEAKIMAYMLLEHFTSYAKLSVCLNPHIEIDNFTVDKINNAIDELKTHKPIQYVLGKILFYDLPFYVNESVLIPRPETEELVKLVLENSSQATKILDICTGSGCIAIALAYYLKESQVYGIDISEKALEIAKKNAELNHTAIHFLEKDILSPYFEEEIDTHFDIIVSNPPYIRESERKYMHQRVLNYEPDLALFVNDENPLLFYHKIVKIGRSLLNPDGKIYFEINESFGKEIVSLFMEYGYSDVILHNDINNKDRIVSGKLIK